LGTFSVLSYAKLKKNAAKSIRKTKDVRKTLCGQFWFCGH